jgi:hypothetical protein
LVHHRQLSIAKRAAIEDALLLERMRDHGLTMVSCRFTVGANAKRTSMLV